MSLVGGGAGKLYLVWNLGGRVIIKSGTAIPKPWLCWSQGLEINFPYINPYFCPFLVNQQLKKKIKILLTFLFWFGVFLTNFFPTVEFKFHSNLMDQLKAQQIHSFQLVWEFTSPPFLEVLKSLLTHNISFYTYPCWPPWAASPWSSPPASGEAQLQCLEHLFPLLIHWPWCLQHCSSCTISLFSDHNYICLITFFTS